MKEKIEISRKLAAAIGWPEDHIKVTDIGVAVGPKSQLQIFDYEDPCILWPLAVAYDAFPQEGASPVKKEWIASSGKTKKSTFCRADNPMLATALAIIEASKTFNPRG